jgi:four helix bundle protein
MGRNHERLRVFHEGHSVVLAVYRHTQAFPRDEWFGLRSQIRRAAVSVTCNVVEGSARGTTRDYLRFLHIALGSSSELKYLVGLAEELSFVAGPEWTEVRNRCDLLVRQLQRLVDRMDTIAESDRPSR